MNDSLNNLKNEVRERFLDQLGEKKSTIEDLISMLEEELSLLKSVINDKSRFGHQIYDMLFILFTLASEHEIDLDEQWKNGWIKKQKYLKS